MIHWTEQQDPRHWTDEQDRIRRDRQEKNLDRICWWVIGIAALYVGAHLAVQAYMWNYPA